MIISHRYKFIYIKTEKTASTSLAYFFRRIAEASGTVHFASPSNKRRIIKEHGSLEHASFGQAKGMFRRNLPTWHGLHGHASASQIRSYIGHELFDQYTIITSERNPWDRQVSLFSHRIQNNIKFEITDFDRCMKSTAYNLTHYNRIRNWDLYTLDGEVCADFVIRFESLQDDLEQVLEQLGIDPRKHLLEHRRKRSQAFNYRDLYSDESRDLIHKWHADEIKYFNYTF